MDHRDKTSYRFDEAAAELSVHVDTIRRWVREGRIAVIGVGQARRILRAVLLALIP